MKDNLTVKIFQEDWIPGFGGFRNYKDQEDKAHAHIVLNVGSLLAMVEECDCEIKELPYVIADTLMHEMIHVFEQWAHVEFSEEKVESLLERYREKYEVPDLGDTDSRS